MAKVKLSLQSLTDLELVNFTRAHIAEMTGNANFPTPDPDAATLLTIVDAFEDDITALRANEAAGKEIKIRKDGRRDDLSGALNRRGRYVEGVSGGDEAIIASAGFATRSPAAPVGIPQQPGNLVATIGDMVGTVDLSWDRVRGAASYIIQLCPDPVSEPNWRFVNVSPKSSFTVEGLTSGSKYWFRVAAVGTAGQGPWSDPATKMAG